MNKDNIISAANENNIDQSSITKCCKGKVRTAGGFIWRYVSDIDNLDASHSSTALIASVSSASRSLSEAV